MKIVESKEFGVVSIDIRELKHKEIQQMHGLKEQNH